ncbi:MAG: Flp pilus assembly complex ATPase component TadA [Actinobacteria bacterium]|nr:Flp pilus assembly complex ATPase component TadA [Actinomycetota bacterium]
MSDAGPLRQIAEHHDLDFVDLDRYPVDFAAGRLLPEAIARRHYVLPIGRKFGTPVVAVADPADVFAMDTLRAAIGREFIAMVADRSQISSYVTKLYGTHTAAEIGRSHGPVPPVQTHGHTPEAGLYDQAQMDAKIAVTYPSLPLQGESPSEIKIPLSKASHNGPQPKAPSELLTPDQARLASLPPPVLSRAIASQKGGSASGAPRYAPLSFSAGTTRSGSLPESLQASSEPADPSPGATGGLAAQGRAEDDRSLAGMPPLARALTASGKVSLAEMELALKEHSATGQSLGRILTAKGLASETDLIWAMAQEIGLQFVDLDTFPIDYSAISFVPEATARHHSVLPIAIDNGTPVVAVANPADVFAMDDLRTVMGRNFITVVATHRQLLTYIDQAYNRGKDVSAAAESAAERDAVAAEDLADIQAVVEDAPIVRYVNLVILQALNERASDIHIEPTSSDLRVRFRIDGVLHDMATAPKSIATGVITRLKVIAEMNIAEHRLPQDGRTSLRMGEREIDLRMATLPTVYGEKVVMRVLDKSKTMLGLPELGFIPDMLARYESVYQRPYGTILVTGPTGSGKSTTLYATLHALNSPERNLITVEDPVEYRISGINQVQLNMRAGLSFATALRAILRSDPDILLIGEIRDRETAVIAAEAALTGHLVLSTLHTNDASGTPMRLIEMGLEPYLVTSALSCVLAQRLARQLCNHCKQPYEPSVDELIAAGWHEKDVAELGTTPSLYRPVGCQACSKTGYRGRIALGEVMLVTEEIERLIIDKASTEDIQRMAIEQGMVTLKDDGLYKVIHGETTFEEVLRVVA